MAPRNWRFAHDSDCLEPPGTEDDVFRVEAAKMKENVKTSKSKKYTKMFVAEIVYKGRRHEVWFNRSQIRYRKVEQLAGYIKTKTMQG